MFGCFWWGVKVRGYIDMITQRINLYKVQVGSEPDLSFFRMIQICGVFLIILSFYSTFLWVGGHHKVKDLNKIKLEKITLENKFMQKNSALNLEGEKKKLQSQIDWLTSDLDQKRLFLKALNDQGLNQKKGFSRFLEGISENRVEGAWITKIVIQDGGSHVALSGSAMRAKLVPLVFQGLSNDLNYKGKSFGTILIQKSSDFTDKKSSVKKNDDKKTEIAETVVSKKVSKDQVDFEAKTEGMK